MYCHSQTHGTGRNFSGIFMPPETHRKEREALYFKNKTKQNQPYGHGRLVVIDYLPMPNNFL